MRMRAWAVLGLGLLAGCATERWSYSKPGLTPARLDRDLGACRRQSARPQWFAVTRDGQLDQAAIPSAWSARVTRAIATMEQAGFPTMSALWDIDGVVRTHLECTRASLS